MALSLRSKLPGLGGLDPGITAGLGILRSPLERNAALVLSSSMNTSRTAAAINPQLSPTRAALVPGNAPFVMSALAPPLRPPPTQLVTPQEPSMSLLGRIGGALKGAVGGFLAGGPAGALGGAALGSLSSGGARRPATAPVLSNPGSSLVGSGPCPPGSMRGPFNSCVDLVPGGRGSGSGIVVSPGETRTTRGGPMIGASAVAPFRNTITVRTCGRGSVLGIDGLCYDKRTIRKDQRMWVPGRKPLMTGGDLNAIAKAARAARRMKVQQRRLEQLGLLKRPKPSRGVITKAEASRALRR